MEAKSKEAKDQAKAGKTESAAKDGVVDLSAKVTVHGTGKYGLTKGKAYEVHPILAESLAKKQAAVYKK